MIIPVNKLFLQKIGIERISYKLVK